MPVPPILGTLESSLYVDDLEAAETFYRGVLGLELVLKQPGRHVFFRVGEGILLVFNPEATQTPPTPGSAIPVPAHGAFGAGHFCFAVEATALSEWRDHLEARRVTIEADFRWPNGARSIYVRDPAGNSIEFAEPSLWN